MCKQKYRTASLGDRRGLSLGDRSPPKRRTEPTDRDWLWPVTDAMLEDDSPVPRPSYSRHGTKSSLATSTLALKGYPDAPTSTVRVEPKVHPCRYSHDPKDVGNRSGGRVGNWSAAARPSSSKATFIAEGDHVAAEAILRKPSLRKLTLRSWSLLAKPPGSNGPKR